LQTTDWEALLAARLDRRVAVTYGRARTAPVQATYGPRTLRLRLHELFRAAPADVAEDLAAWLRAGRRARRACARLDAWIDARLGELPPKPRRRARLAPRGAHHDLEWLAAPLFRHDFRDDFADRPAPGVSWGRRVRSRARRSLMLGSYSPSAHVARVHPVLDDPSVPDWFVRYILFHEILHAALGAEEHHGPRFRAREREYPDYAHATRWQRRHIGRLIRAARKLDTKPPSPAPRQAWLF
jgi:hypothetical protein